MKRTPFEELKKISEEQFEYYELSDAFEVSINFVNEGATVPTHSHDVDVYNYVMRGEFEVCQKGEKQTIRESEWVYIPAKEEHSVVAKTSVQLLELWRR